MQCCFFGRHCQASAMYLSLLIWWRSIMKMSSLFVWSGNDGELRLGIRRATQFKNSTNASTHTSRNLNLTTLPVIANAVSARKVFHVYYDPRYARLCMKILPYVELKSASYHESISSVKYVTPDCFMFSFMRMSYVNI